MAYLSEALVMSAYALEDGTVYMTYSTTARGLEFMMGYYGFLDCRPHPAGPVTRGTRPCDGCAATTSTDKNMTAQDSKQKPRAMARRLIVMHGVSHWSILRPDDT